MATAQTLAEHKILSLMVDIFGCVIMVGAVIVVSVNGKHPAHVGLGRVANWAGQVKMGIMVRIHAAIRFF